MVTAKRAPLGFGLILSLIILSATPVASSVSLPPASVTILSTVQFWNPGQTTLLGTFQLQTEYLLTQNSSGTYDYGGNSSYSIRPAEVNPSIRDLQTTETIQWGSISVVSATETFTSTPKITSTNDWVYLTSQTGFESGPQQFRDTLDYVKLDFSNGSSYLSNSPIALYNTVVTPNSPSSQVNASADLVIPWRSAPQTITTTTTKTMVSLVTSAGPTTTTTSFLTSTSTETTTITVTQTVSSTSESAGVPEFPFQAFILPLLIGVLVVSYFVIRTRDHNRMHG
jgi:hypothetical protein